MEGINSGENTTHKNYWDKILEVEIDPAISGLLLPYQIIDTQNLVFAVRENGIALSCGDTGSGKSYSAAAVCKVMGLRPLFIGPKSGIPNLYSVCSVFGIEPLGNVNYETLKNGKYYQSLDDFYCEERVECPYIEIIREHSRNPITKALLYTKTGQPKMIIKEIIWKLPNKTLLVFDEAHKCRSGKASGNNTGNSKLMISSKPYLNKQNEVYGLFLSATLTDKLNNFDVIAYMLGFYKPYQPKIYGQFLRRYGRNSETVFKKIHSILFPKYASRMSIQDVKEHTGNTIFRENDVQAVMYPVTETIALEIEKNHMKIRQALLEIRSKGISEGWGRLIRYWQRIEVLKVPAAVEIIKQYLSENKAVVVFVNFSETKKLIAENFPIHKTDFIHGQQTSQERETIVQNFQKNDLDLLICQIKAGGISISLQDLHGKQRVSVIFPTWSATDLKQALGRIYRAKAKTDAIQRIVYCKYNTTDKLPEQKEEYEGQGTLSIEEMLCRNVNEKLINIELLNTGNLASLQTIDIPDDVTK